MGSVAEKPVAEVVASRLYYLSAETTRMSTRANPNDIPGFDRGGLMPPPPIKRRHALGLPAGSVRVSNP